MVNNNNLAPEYSVRQNPPVMSMNYTQKYKVNNGTGDSKPLP